MAAWLIWSVRPLFGINSFHTESCSRGRNILVLWAIVICSLLGFLCRAWLGLEPGTKLWSCICWIRGIICHFLVWHHEYVDGTFWRTSRWPLHNKANSTYQHCSRCRLISERCMDSLSCFRWCSGLLVWLVWVSNPSEWGNGWRRPSSILLQLHRIPIKTLLLNLLAMAVASIHSPLLWLEWRVRPWQHISRLTYSKCVRPEEINIFGSQRFIYTGTDPRSMGKSFTWVFCLTLSHLLLPLVGSSSLGPSVSASYRSS